MEYFFTTESQHSVAHLESLLYELSKNPSMFHQGLAAINRAARAVLVTTARRICTTVSTTAVTDYDAVEQLLELAESISWEAGEWRDTTYGRGL